MSAAFNLLSNEGKLNKIREHLQLQSGVPVPAPWVEWLIRQLAPNVSTDMVVDAARITREVYIGNVIKLGKHHARSIGIANEMKRAAIMDALCHDDNLCEMFAGRLDQVSHGVQRK